MEEIFINSKISDLLECINGKDTEGKDFTCKPPNDKSKVKDEFNKFIRKEINERRSKSTIAQLRNFHNSIKRTLLVNISNYAFFKKKKEINLVDIAVGRGGDLQKWQDAKIKNVFGFDNNEESINSVNPFSQGARERYRLMDKKPKVTFEVGDVTNPSPDLVSKLTAFAKEHPVQIVSCQFALHYFFKDEQTLRNVLQLVSQILQPGGYFIGTTTDGKKIKEYLKENKQNQLISLTKKGKGYLFKVNDSFESGNYFNTIPESLEYFTDFKKLNTLAAEYGLIPDNTNYFEKIPNSTEYARINSSKPDTNTIPFEEIPHDDFKMTQEQLELNSLYTVFLFKKK